MRNEFVYLSSVWYALKFVFNQEPIKRYGIQSVGIKTQSHLDFCKKENQKQ